MVNQIADGVYFIRNKGTSDVLDINPLRRVIHGPINISALDSQLFQVEMQKAQGSGYYLIRNNSTGMVLELAGGNAAAGTPVFLATPSGNKDQLWDIQPVIGQSKLYSITNVDSRTALEVSATGISAGPFTAIDNQYWDFQLATGFQPTTATTTPTTTTTSPVAPLNPQIPQVRGRPGDTTTVTLFATGNICGNPQCGKSFICAADYNRVVQPMGYPGVR